MLQRVKAKGKWPNVTPTTHLQVRRLDLLPRQRVCEGQAGEAGQVRQAGRQLPPRDRVHVVEGQRAEAGAVGDGGEVRVGEVRHGATCHQGRVTINLLGRAWEHDGGTGDGVQLE